MKTSVIIPNYNYADFLSLAIDSLLQQTEKIDEIIVVDDGSTDNSRAVMESYGDKIIPVYQQNGGQASAISNGFARSSGDIVCILDSDDIFFPDKVKILKQLYAANDSAGWIFHSLRHLNPEQAREVSQYPRYDHILERKIDERGKMKAGKSMYFAPATSGLTFRRSFIAPLFPLPQAKSIYISDHYIKFYSMAQGTGLDIAEELGGQIIHGENLYTGAKALATRARIFVNTAYALEQKLPSIRLFCTNLMTEGLVCAKKARVERELQGLAKEYFSRLTTLERAWARGKLEIKSFLKLSV